MATVGTVIIDVKADTAKLISGMDKAEKSIKKTVSGIQTAIISMATAYVGIQGVKAFTHMINDSIDAADATGKLAQKLGLTTDALSEYQYAAGFAAVSNGELNAGLSALIRRLNNFERTGGGAAKQAFLELGISSEYARKHFTSTDIAFKEILKRLEKMPDGFKKTAIAQDIFSKSASGIMRITATDLKKFSDEAKKIGISIPQSAYEMAAAYHDQMDQLESRMKGMKQTVSLSLISPMNAASQTAVEMYDAMFVDSVAKIDNFQNSASNAIINIVNAVGFLKDSFTGIQIVIKSLELVFYGLASAISKALETPMNAINNMVTAYNALAKKMHLDTIDFKLVSSYEDNINEVKNIASEIRKLSSTISDGRNFAKKFESQYLSTLEKIKAKTKEVSQTTSDASDIVIAKSQSELKAIEKVNKAKSKQEVNNVFSIINSETASNQGLYDEALLKITPEIDIVNEKFKSLHEVIKDVFNPDQLKAFYQVWGDEASKAKEAAVIEPITIDFRMKGFDDISNAMAGVSNSFMDLSTHSSQFAKDMKKAGKSSELQEDAMMKYGVASLGTFSNMTGAMASFYDEDDDRRKKQLELSKVINAAQMAMQMALLPGQIASAIAQSGAMAGIPGVIAMVAMLGSLGIMAMGSGGSSSSTNEDPEQVRQDAISAELDLLDADYTPILDKFDRQIELLEKISGYGGTVTQLGIEQALEQFNKDSSKYMLEASSISGNRITERMYIQPGETYGDLVSRAVIGSGRLYEKIFGTLSKYIVSSIDKSTGKGLDFVAVDKYADVSLNASSFKSSSEFIEVLSDLKNKGLLDDIGISLTEYNNIINDYQNANNELIVSILDGVETMKDFSSSLQDIFDKIGNNKYKTQKLSSAFDDIELLTSKSGLSYSDYIKQQIESINALEKSLDSADIALLLSTNINDFSQQQALISRVQEETGNVLNVGVAEALNFIDSIKLVGEALTKSNENIKSWKDSFKDNDELAQDMASKLGVSLAKSFSELNALFDSLSSDNIGLTDTELDLLQANKDLLDAQQGYIDKLNTFADGLLSKTLSVDVNYSQSMALLSASLAGFATSTDKSKSSSDIQKYANNAISYIGSNSTSISDEKYKTALIANSIKDTVTLDETGSFKTVEDKLDEMKVAIVAELSDIKSNTEKEYA